MKLIDLLVQELPKRGGFPQGYKQCVQDKCGKIKFYDSSNLSYREFYWAGVPDANVLCIHNLHITEFSPCSDQSECIITREQYEAALAASQQPAWDGEGLPPVGTIVDIIDIDERLRYGQNESGEVLAHVENTAVVRMSYGLGCFEAEFLRPMRTEAERKREVFVESLMTEWLFLGHDGEQARALYDAIAAGKIPGVKLED